MQLLSCASPGIMVPMGESSHVKAFRARHLGKEETIKASAEGYIGKMMGSGKDTQHNGVLIVTEKSVTFYRKGFFGEVHQSIPLKSITSIEQKSMLGHRTVRIHTSHDDLEFKTLDAAGYAQLLGAIEAGRSPSLSTHSTGPGDSPLDALRKLGDLRAAGVITDAEFEAKKASLLAKV